MKMVEYDDITYKVGDFYDSFKHKKPTKILWY